MGVNKVVFGAVAVMDISDSTVTEDTLAEGAVAYGADGERLTGKMKPGVELPELGDTAAQPSDIAYGKVLYDDEGNPVTGTLADFKPGVEGRYIFRTNARVSGVTGLFVEAESSLSASPIIHRPGSTATVQISSAAFGDATPDQVAKGATFTSAAGLLVEGTREEPTVETWVFTLEDGSTVTKEVHIE